MQPIPIDKINIRVAGIIWGDAKTGKTTYACSLPGKKLIINCDPDGFLSVIDRDDIDVLDFSNMPANEMLKNCEKAAAFIVENKDKYESIIFDSLTPLVAAALQDAVSRGLGKSNKFVPSIEVPGLVAYGARTTKVNSIVTSLLKASSKANAHMYFTAHSDDPEFDKDGKNIVRQTMMLNAKVRNMTGLMVSDIYHLAISSNGSRVLYFAPFGVKQPMGSRIIDTKKISKLTLNYDPDVDDASQPHSLTSIISKWKDKKAKLTSI